jgi:hypothetical protein
MPEWAYITMLAFLFWIAVELSFTHNVLRDILKRLQEPK